jgi:hypothetical protein
VGYRSRRSPTAWPEGCPGSFCHPHARHSRRQPDSAESPDFLHGNQPDLPGQFDALLKWSAKGLAIHLPKLAHAQRGFLVVRATGGTPAARQRPNGQAVYASFYVTAVVKPAGRFFSAIALGATSHPCDGAGGFRWRWGHSPATPFSPCGRKPPSPDALCVVVRSRSCFFWSLNLSRFVGV